MTWKQVSSTYMAGGEVLVEVCDGLYRATLTNAPRDHADNQWEARRRLADKLSAIAAELRK